MTPKARTWQAPLVERVQALVPTEPDRPSSLLRIAQLSIPALKGVEHFPIAHLLKVSIVLPDRTEAKDRLFKRDDEYAFASNLRGGLACCDRDGE